MFGHGSLLMVHVSLLMVHGSLLIGNPLPHLPHT